MVEKWIRFGDEPFFRGKASRFHTARKIVPRIVIKKGEKKREEGAHLGARISPFVPCSLLLPSLGPSLTGDSLLPLSSFSLSFGDAMLLVQVTLIGGSFLGYVRLLRTQKIRTKTREEIDGREGEKGKGGILGVP